MMSEGILIITGMVGIFGYYSCNFWFAIAEESGISAMCLLDSLLEKNEWLVQSTGLSR